MKQARELFSFIVSLLALLPTLSLSQDWSWQNPLPQGNSLYAVQVIDASTVVCVGEAGTFLKSTNAGTGWTVTHHVAGTSKWLAGVSFADANTGTAVGADGTIVRTTNGGLSWSLQNSTTVESLHDVSFTDPDTGTAVGELGTILRTTDGGTTWVDRSIGGPNSLGGVSFTDANTGTVVGGSTIVRTTDGGASWKTQASGVTSGLTDVCFVDVNTGTAVGGNGTILRTTNGGTTWVSQTSGTTFDLDRVSFIDRDIGMVVTLSPVAFRTTNGGETWMDASPGGEFDLNLQAVSLQSANLGLLVGDNGAMYKSTNAGSTWLEVSNGSTTAVNGVAFLDDATGIGVGSGILYRTTDGGVNWATQTVTGYMLSIWFSDSQNGTAVGLGGSNGVILRTTDRGVSWSQLAPPGGNLFAVHFADSQNGIAVGDRIIVRTSDGGLTWQILLYGTIPVLSDVWMINQSTAIAVGGPTVLRTSDGGISWQSITTPTGGASGVAFVDANTGVAVTGGGSIIRTTDAGITWSLQVSNTTNSLSAVRFNPSGTEGIAVGSLGTVLRSSDSGITWNIETSPTLKTLYGVSPTGDVGWTAVGSSGAILHRSSSVTPASPVIVDIAIDSLNMIVPAEGDTFGYHMTFTNLTASSQVVDAWTKVLRPIGNPIDPLYGPVTLTLDPFEVVVINTAQMGVPFDARSGEYSLIAFVGTYQADTLDADTAAFVKLPSVPCEDIAQFQARCRPGGTVQARVTLTDNSHTGDRVEFTIDDVAFEATVAQNRRALLSLPGFALGAHTVELTEPPGCFDLVTVMCPAGLEKGEDEWEEDIQSSSVDSDPSAIALYDSYPNPFNPITRIQYDLPEEMYVTLRVYDILGREVTTLVDGIVQAGRHTVTLDGTNLASGLYYSRISAGSFQDARRLLLVK